MSADQRETEELFARWRESERRSRERRAAGGRRRRPGRAPSSPRQRRLTVGIAAAVLVVVVGAGIVQDPAGEQEPRGSATALIGVARAAAVPPLPAPRDLFTVAAERLRTQPPRVVPRKVPSAAALRDAWAYARDRTGAVSLAVVDSAGKLRGRDENRRYASASVVKAMLLAAEVRRLKREDLDVDAATDGLLRAMITYSDNGAADSIYARVGDAGLFDVARRLGMRRFTVAGYWGNAQIAAGDMARFFGDLDRAFPRRHREYAKGLLGSVIASQSWGIPAAAGRKWAVRFKGGWLPDHALVHQAAELREREGPRELSIAVLTDDQPSHEYGVETVRGVAERLLRNAGAG